ncbi:MAG: hypothetical protein VX874_18035 [Pseudomonadota bacterium]|nr:hypothetical protein [Pseudomonadota bacterium]
MGSTIKNVAAAAAVAVASVGGTAAHAQSAFDGFYLGAFLQNDFAGTFRNGAIDGAVGLFAGYNYMVSNGFVVGAEAEVQYDWATLAVPAGTAFTGIANARVGYTPTSNIMVYAKGGAGFMSNGGGAVYNYGLGAEYAMGSYFVRAEGMRVNLTNGAPNRTDLKLGIGVSF